MYLGVYFVHFGFNPAGILSKEMNNILVAAIDFGTTYSGYAYSFVHEFQNDPLKIYTNQWSSGSGRLQTEKTSTCVLFNPKGEFHSFGFEAEEKYSELALESKHEPWYYFRRFKMDLYHGQAISKSMEIEEEGTKKKMDALKVFSASIKYLRDHMVSSCKSKFPEIEEDDILWILTVPAIWTDAAKQFMRMAAEQAGISTERLKIALEPEAASIYCKYLPMGNRGNTFEPGSKYMVIDAGGGTIDITVHEVQTNNSLKELYSANGGPWGGTKVDDALQCLLTDIFGEDVMQEFSKSQKMDQLDLFRDFEIKKKTVKPEFKKDEFITLRVPHSLSSLYSVLKGRDISLSVQSNEKYKAKLKWFGEKLRMEPGITKELFDESCNQIVKHVQSILCENAMRDVGTILLVGGYAESLMLQKAIKTNFNQLKVISTPEAGLSVLKGSVIFGHEPDAISSRVSKYTYGIRTNVDFNPSEHPEEKKTLVNGIEKCKDIFNIHVRVGETMHVGEPTTSQTYFPQIPDQKTIGFTIFTSPCKNPKFTTDPRSRFLGYLRLHMPETSKNIKKEVDVQMTFSGTEIEVSAIDKITKKAVKTSVDFLH